MSLSQGELPTAPAGSGWDDRIQSGEAWRWQRQLQKDPVHRSPSERDQQQLTRVLPPGCHWRPQYLAVITEGHSVQYQPTSRHWSSAKFLWTVLFIQGVEQWQLSSCGTGILKMTEGLSSLFPFKAFPLNTHPSATLNELFISLIF